MPPLRLLTMTPLPSGTAESVVRPPPDAPPPADVPPPEPVLVFVVPPFELSEPSEQAATTAPGATSATIRPHRTSRRDRRPAVGVFVGVVGSTAVKPGLPSVSAEITPRLTHLPAEVFNLIHPNDGSHAVTLRVRNRANPRADRGAGRSVFAA